MITGVADRISHNIPKQKVSFRADKEARKAAMPPLPDNFYSNISKNSANNLIRHALFKSKGREEKDGKLGFAASMMLGAGYLLLAGSAVKKIFKAPKETAGEFFGMFAPSRLKNHFAAKLGVALLLVGIGINFYNNFDAKRTAKERGVKDKRQPVTSPELQRLEKETKELEKKQYAELTKLYSAEYDANMAVYQKVLGSAPVGYFSLGKPVE